MPEHHPRDPLVALLLVLTATTGLVDAVSVLGLGRVFTANMTGNVAFLGFAAIGIPDFSLLRCSTALASFLLGAAVGGCVAAVLRHAPRGRWLLVVALIEAGLLFAAALAAHGYDFRSLAPARRLYEMIVLTGIAMGLRNATAHKIGVPDLSTTVVTRTLSGLAADSTLAGGGKPRWQRRLGAVVFLFAGALIGGVLVYRVGLAIPLVISGATGVVTTGWYARHPSARNASGSAA
ncbi:MAG: YoaK family protein [Burkholderiaceae bacterium]